jgi:hypothetical protein
MSSCDEIREIWPDHGRGAGERDDSRSVMMMGAVMRALLFMALTQCVIIGLAMWIVFSAGC